MKLWNSIKWSSRNSSFRRGIRKGSGKKKADENCKLTDKRNSKNFKYNHTKKTITRYIINC